MEDVVGIGLGGFDNWMRTDAILTSYSPFPFVAREARVCSLWQRPTRRQTRAGEIVVARTRGQTKEFRIKFSFYERALGEA